MKKLHVFPAIVTILGTVLVFGLLANVNVGPFSFLRVYVVHAADAYGNDITHVEVSEYNTTAWNLVQNFTGNGSCRVHDQWEISFLIGVQINETLLSANSTGQADAQTRVNMTITHENSTLIWDNVPLNSTGTPFFESPYWYVLKLGNWTASLPEQGVTYNCTITYEKYY